MKLGYVAGPFRSETQEGVNENIRRAASVGHIIRKHGFAAIVPHLESLHNQEALDEDGWIRHNIELLSRCDFMIVLENWSKSKGTILEIENAKEIGIPIYYWPDMPVDSGF